MVPNILQNIIFDETHGGLERHEEEQNERFGELSL